MTGNKESLFWKTDKAWWYIGDDNEYRLTDEAPDRAVKSFDLFNSRYDHRTGKVKQDPVRA